MNERLPLLKWSISGFNLLLLFHFVIKKITQRLSYRIGSQKYVPVVIMQQASCLANNIDAYQNTVTKDFCLPEDKDKSATIYKIKLATGFFSCDKKIDWHMPLNDPEDQEALHRWSFFITELSSLKEERKPNELLLWIDSCINDWIDTFQSELNEPTQHASLPRWDSYTVGERISNAVVVYNYFKKNPNKKIQQALIKMAVYLANHLEYHAENFNHIVNNARALYLLGSFLEKDEFKKLTTTILYAELPKLVTEDGFLREGSSHYQLLFTRWLLEVNYFAQQCDDINLQDFLSTYLTKLVERCQFFLVSDDSKNLYIPLIGDISPDFSPNWLVNLPYSRLASEFINDEKFLESRFLKSKSSWNNLWDHGPASKERLITHRHESYPNSGWYKNVVGDHIVFYRLSQTPNYFPGHFHNDALHFCLFYKGSPILVDSGRKTYNQACTWGTHGLSASAHNTVLIDGLSAMPARLARYPKGYSQCKNVAEQELRDDRVDIVLSSDGFKRISKTLKHKRSLQVENNEVVISDSFAGKGEHQIQIMFHFDAAARLTQQSKHRWDVCVGNHSGYFEIDGSEDLSVSCYCGDENMIGWRSHEYGQVAKACSLVISGKFQFPVSIKNILSWN